MNMKHPMLQLAVWGILTSLISYKVLASNDDKILEVAVGWSKPPYVNAADDSGFELDMIRQIFARMGYKFKPVYVPYGRSLSLLQSGRVDGALTLSENAAVPPVQLTDSYIQYQNVAVSLQSKHLDIKQPKDLAGYAIAAYQTAAKNLGEQYAYAVKQAPLYVELPDQTKQVAMLLNGNVSVLIIDVNIFNNLQAVLEPGTNRQPITIHHIFSPSDYHVGFLNPNLAQDFNQALKAYQTSLAHQELVHKYNIFADEDV